MRLGLGNTFLGGAATNQFANNAFKITFNSPEQSFSTSANISMSGNRVPQDIPGVVMWLNPATSSSTTTNGAAVSTYTDKIFGDYSFTSSGSNRPTYSATGLNGHPGLLFTAASSQKMTDTGTRRNWSSPGVIFVVMSIVSVSSNSGASYANVGVVADGDNGYQGIFLRSSGPTILSYWWDGSDKHADTTFTLGTPFLYTYTVTGVPSGVITAQVNNGTIVSTSGIGNRVSFTAPVQMGHGAGGYLNGTIGDVMMLNQYDVNDVGDIQQYLRAKYGLW